MRPNPISDWFHRTVGMWRSERTYIFSPDGKPQVFTTMLDIFHDDDVPQGYVIKWEGKTSGEMRISLDGNILRRSRDYFGNGAHDSVVSMLDDDTIVLRTEYDGIKFIEEIRLAGHDNYRLRRTFGTKADGSFALYGAYCEFRIPNQ
jgi:hypothetical protein